MLLAHLEEDGRKAGMVVRHCACLERMQVERPEVIQEGGELREAAGGAEEDAKNLPAGVGWGEGNISCTSGPPRSSAELA